MTTAPRRRPGPALVWIGLTLIGAGLLLILLAWGLVAGETAVEDQLAPLVLAGLGGVAVTIVGLGVVHIGTARRDEDEHARQLAALTEVLDQLRSKR